MGVRGTFKQSGIPIPVGITRGNIFFVASTTMTGDDAPSDDVGAGYGKTPARPFATIDYAFNQCVASQGDEIHVLHNHAETLTDTNLITMDTVGVSIIGHGNFLQKPTLTMSATAAGINVTAADCSISGIRFTSSIDSLLNFLSLGASGFLLDGCDFVTANTFEAVCFISITTTFDDFIFRDCTFLQPTDPDGTDAAAETGAIFCVDTENLYLERCRFRGNFETAIIHNRTTLVNNLVLKDCELVTDLATSLPLVLVAASTGSAVGCYGETKGADDATLAKVWGTLGVNFWIHPTSALGNDSAAGGQGSIIEATAS